MKNFINTVILTMSAALLGACSTGEYVLNEDVSAIKIDKGDTFKIELNGNRTTGYEWVVLSDGSPILYLKKQTYIPNKVSEGVVGSGGVENFYFDAAQKGKALIELTYKRNWEKKGIDTRRFYVDVE